MTAVVGMLPLAVAVTVSPVPIAVEVTLLLSRRRLPNAAAYVLGFSVGVATVLCGLVLLAARGSVSQSHRVDVGIAAVTVLLGVMAVALAGAQLRRRPDQVVVTRPAWFDGISELDPSRSLGVGFLVGAANPKNVAVAILAAVTIAAAGTPSASGAVAVAVYVAVAVAGVAAPLVVAVLFKERSVLVLEGWRTRLMDGSGRGVGLVLLALGIFLVVKGVRAY